MVSLRETVRGVDPAPRSLRRLLRDEFLVSSPTVSLREQLGRTDTYDSVVIFVHGVSTNAHTPYGQMEEKLRARWPAEMARTLVVKLFWGHVPANEWSSVIGTRTDQVWGISDEGWSGTAKLCDAIGRVQHVLGADVPICVVAYSQGSCVTLATLQEGLEIDNLILLGSPLDRGAVRERVQNTEFMRAVGQVRGEVINCSSEADWGAGTGATLSELGGDFAFQGDLDGRAIGGAGLPRAALAHPRVHGLYLDKVDHTGWFDAGWWDALWIDAGGDRWEGVTPAHFIRVLTSANRAKAPRVVLPRGQAALEAHADHVHGDTRRGWFGSSDRDRFSSEVYVPAETIIRWHFDDKDDARYTIDVTEGSVRARLREAEYQTF